MPIITVDHATKTYHLGQLISLKQTLINLAQRLRGRPTTERKTFNAIEDMVISIEPGEVVGIIGHNGAGKSTLLKLLAKISTPTSGTIFADGTIAPLIEVGAGLVPDLTGRENIYLNGTILGMSKEKIDRNFDSIVSFAELEDFIDTPIKRYSSGMQVRLGFSIATSADAEILIVDEVLAVGDLAFQRKCFNRMEDIIKRQGKTVLIVSHNIRQVSRICSRVIMLEHGKVLADGSPSEICDLFYRRSNAKVLSDNTKDNNKRIESSGEAQLLSIEILDQSGQPHTSITCGSPLRVRATFSLKRDFEKLEIVIGTHTTDFVYLNSGSTAALPKTHDFQSGTHTVEFSVESYPLAPGTYSTRFALLDKNRRMVFTGEALSMFSVESPSIEVNEAEARLLDLPSHWIIDGQRVERDSQPY